MMFIGCNDFLKRARRGSGSQGLNATISSQKLSSLSLPSFQTASPRIGSRQAVEQVQGISASNHQVRYRESGDEKLNFTYESQLGEATVEFLVVNPIRGTAPLRLD